MLHIVGVVAVVRGNVVVIFVVVMSDVVGILRRYCSISILRARHVYAMDNYPIEVIAQNVYT